MSHKNSRKNTVKKIFGIKKKSMDDIKEECFLTPNPLIEMEDDLV